MYVAVDRCIHSGLFEQQVPENKPTRIKSMVGHPGPGGMISRQRPKTVMNVAQEWDQNGQLGSSSATSFEMSATSRDSSQGSQDSPDLSGNSPRHSVGDGMLGIQTFWVLQGCESICEEKSEIIWNAWKDVLFNALTVWKWGFVKSKKVWNQIKIWTLTSLELWGTHCYFFHH